MLIHFAAYRVSAASLKHGPGACCPQEGLRVRGQCRPGRGSPGPTQQPPHPRPGWACPPRLRSLPSLAPRLLGAGQALAGPPRGGPAAGQGRGDRSLTHPERGGALPGAAQRAARRHGAHPAVRGGGGRGVAARLGSRRGRAACGRGPSALWSRAHLSAGGTGAPSLGSGREPRSRRAGGGLAGAPGVPSPWRAKSGRELLGDASGSVQPGSSSVPRQSPPAAGRRVASPGGSGALHHTGAARTN